MNEELVWIADREFCRTTAGLRANAPLAVFGTDESTIAQARAHVRALLGKSTAFEVEGQERAFSCHVRPLYDERESIVGSFGVAIELHEVSTDPRGGATPARVARRMRAFSRPGRTAPFDVVEHLRALLPRIEGLVPSSVAVVFDRSGGNAFAAFDAERFTQVVIGLVGNARDAMPHGGTIRIEVTRCAETIEVVVADDGIGMPGENLAQVFEPYFTTKPGHAGLGLPTARVLLTAGGGSIRLASAPGAGTAVTIVLPVAGT